MEIILQIFSYCFLQGNDNLVCSNEGTWTGDLPSCVPKPCGLFDQPKNTKTHFESPSGYDLGFGSVARLNCIPGYVSQEESFLKCHQDGSWKGHVYPCVPVSFVEFSLIA